MSSVCLPRSLSLENGGVSKNHSLCTGKWTKASRKLSQAFLRTPFTEMCRSIRRKQDYMIFILRTVRRWYLSRGTLCPSTMGTSIKVKKIPISVGFALRRFFSVASHHHVRESVGIFDVGHMVQSK